MQVELLLSKKSGCFEAGLCNPPPHPPTRTQKNIYVCVCVCGTHTKPMVLKSLATISLVFGAPSMPYGALLVLHWKTFKLIFGIKNIHLMSIDFRMLLSK